MGIWTIIGIIMLALILIGFFMALPQISRYNKLRNM